MPEPAQPEDDQALREIISRGVNIGITFTSASLLGEDMSLADVIKLIGPLDRDSCLMLLGSLTGIACGWSSRMKTDGRERRPNWMR